ncbi:MAG: phytanoyl-CoA dioxygenase family protein, partial [Chlamydiia bacterium]|nr:phytanoyl-CoA dioxygenase family protein [Chlamydiia bacterium]
GQQDALQEKLIARVRENCARPDMQQRYLDYQNAAWQSQGSFPSFPTYPLDEDGFAISFDPVADEEGFWDCWQRFGFVVGKQVVSAELCRQTTDRVRSLLAQLSDGAYLLDNPATYPSLPKDPEGQESISRGFFELYHDNCLAQLRQSLRLYLHHVLIWGRADLWTSFDRLGAKTRDPENARGLPIHVDQNPYVHPGFQTTQGVLALVDCPIERGTYVAVPNSRSEFGRYCMAVDRHDPQYRGEYVEAGWDGGLMDSLAPHAQAIPLRAGDIVTWDSRTTHGNSPNRSDQVRMVAYISAGPARMERLDAVEARLDAFKTGMGSNVREALMHASKPPRCRLATTLAPLREPEALSLLGKRLYGLEGYDATETTPA